MMRYAHLPAELTMSRLAPSLFPDPTVLKNPITAEYLRLCGFDEVNPVRCVIDIARWGYTFYQRMPLALRKPRPPKRKKKRRR